MLFGYGNLAQGGDLIYGGKITNGALGAHIGQIECGDNQCKDPMNNNKDCRVGQLTTKLLATKQQLRFSCRAEVEDFFKRMDRDYDGRLSFGEFMGEETPLEKVNVIFVGQTSVFISISTKVGLLNKTMQVFKSMDKDGSGTITKEEFLKICKNLSKEQVK